MTTTAIKVCSICQQDKPAAAFRTNRTACKSCLAQRRAKAYAIGRFVSDLAKARPCADCKQSFPAVCMDWDHRPGTNKKFAVSLLAGQKPSSIFKEISKCDLVCANCHRIRTAERRGVS